MGIARQLLDRMSETEYKTLKNLYKSHSDKFYPGSAFPSTDGIKAIAKVLGCGVSDLLWTRENDANSYTRDLEPHGDRPGYVKYDEDEGYLEWYISPSKDKTGVQFSMRRSNGSPSVMYVVNKSKV